jgi:hypothetical protein
MNHPSGTLETHGKNLTAKAVGMVVVKALNYPRLDVVLSATCFSPLSVCHFSRQITHSQGR